MDPVLRALTAYSVFDDLEAMHKETTMGPDDTATCIYRADTCRDPVCVDHVESLKPLHQAAKEADEAYHAAEKHLEDARNEAIAASQEHEKAIKEAAKHDEGTDSPSHFKAMAAGTHASAAYIIRERARRHRHEALRVAQEADEALRQARRALRVQFKAQEAERAVSERRSTLSVAVRALLEAQDARKAASMACVAGADDAILDEAKEALASARAEVERLLAEEDSAR